MFQANSLFLLTDKLVDYAQKQFRWYLKKMDQVASASHSPPGGTIPPLAAPANPGPLPSLDLSAQLVTDCEILACEAAKAYLNHGKDRHS